MRDKATIIAQIDARTNEEVKAIEAQIDARLDDLVLPCHIQIGAVSPAALAAITAMYEQQGKWTVEVFEEKNDTITLAFS